MAHGVYAFQPIVEITVWLFLHVRDVGGMWLNS